MLSHDELLAQLRRMRDAEETTNADLARILKLPSSRIADIFATDRKPRKISVDEMKLLVEHFGEKLLPPETAELGTLLQTLGSRGQRKAVQMLRIMLDEEEGDQQSA